MTNYAVAPLKKPTIFYKYYTPIVYSILAIFGLLVAYALVKHSPLANPYTSLDEYYMWLRIDWLELFVKDMAESGFYTGLHRLYDHNAGMYLYLSHFGNWFGLSSEEIFFYTQLIFVYSLVASYPIIFYRLTKSIPVAMASIFFFRIYRSYGIFDLTDSYWIYAYSTLLLLPIFFFLFRDKWDKLSYLWSGIILFVIGLANIFRANAGLPASILLFVLICYKLIYPYYITHKKFLLSLIKSSIYLFTIFIFNNLFIFIIPNLYQSLTAQPSCLPIKGPWHSVYIGLGWEENPYGIIYFDDFAMEGREHLFYNVQEGYYVGKESPEYIAEMKDVYINTILSDPGFFAASYMRKSFYSLATSFKWSLLNPSFLSLMSYNFTRYFNLILLIGLIFFSKKIYLAFPRYKNNLFVALFLIFTSSVLGLIPGLIATPIVREYLFATVASFDCIILFLYILFLYLFFDFTKDIFNKYKHFLNFL